MSAPFEPPHPPNDSRLFPRVLLCHNYYQQPGGEDAVLADEAALLSERGHEVTYFTAHNDAVERMNRPALAARTIWSRQSYRKLRGAIRARRPDIVHCTNTFPLLSPAVYYAARAEGVPVVQSLHNFRLLCPNALLHRAGRVCTDCLGHAVPWPGVLHGCYRGSRSATAVVAAMLTLHRALGTWTAAVDRYIVLSEFCRRQFVEGGLAEDRLSVKPNFVAPDPGAGRGQGGYAAYVGRLAPEKGIESLLAAWTQCAPPLPLRIVGDGPMRAQVRAAAAANPRVQWLGRRDAKEVADIVGDAACLLVPSTWFEHFPKTVVEAFAKGTPVVASRLGSLTELVQDGVTGLHCTPGDPGDLAATVALLLSDAAKLAAMRQAARQEYQNKYTAQANYQQLMEIYRKAAHGNFIRSNKSKIRNSIF